jgi:hypothetical protein
VVHGSTKAERRAARERVSSYYDAELARLVERVEQAIARYRVGEIDVHDVDEVIRRYARALEVLLVGRLGLASRVRRSDARTLGGRSGSGRLVGGSGQASAAPLTRAPCARRPRRVPETSVWTWNRSFDTLHAEEVAPAQGR